MSGIKNISVNGLDLIITTNDGQNVTMTFPKPADGKDAILIKDIKVDENKHLIFTMDDNSTIDAGELPKCECDTPSGGGFISVDTKDNLPTPGEDNILYITLDTGDLYYWDNEYKLISSSCNCGDLGLATKDDIDSLFDDTTEKPDNFGLATKEDIDSLFGDDINNDDDLNLATKDDIDSLFKDSINEPSNDLGLATEDDIDSLF